jgi:phosphate transport system substrate-binding protein
LGAARRDAEAGIPVKLLPLRGVPAEVERVVAGEFPLARPLILLTRGEPSGVSAALLEYALSPAVDDLIESLAYVPPRR